MPGFPAFRASGVIVELFGQLIFVGLEPAVNAARIGFGYFFGLRSQRRPVALR